MNLKVDSEVGRLRRVLMCRPGTEQEMIHPDRIQSLLVEDLVWLKPMAEAYSLFVESLEIQGVEVLFFRDLLKEVMSGEYNRRRILEKVFRHRPDSKLENIRWTDISSDDVVRYLISGEVKQDGFPELDPIPNIIFTRDYGAVLIRSILAGEFCKNARKRESLLAREVFSHSRVFCEAERIISCNSNSQATVEGGDIKLLSPNVVVIGISERTSKIAVRQLIPHILNCGIQTVITVQVPSERAYMHLDTIFTMISRNECIVDAPLLITNDRETRVKVVKHVQGEDPKEFDFLLEALASEDINLHPIFCGGNDSLYQAREQWTDGANALAVMPGVIYQYRRNVKTIEALKAAGYYQVQIEDVVRDRIRFDSSCKVVITIPCYELSRMRGGSHCLTFPVLRD